jgi:S1-C subfamily serine protease
MPSRFAILDPRYWLLLLIGIVFIGLSFGYAYAGEKAVNEKMQKEMFSPTAQLNANCSATLISSTRDEKSGDVTTVFLTAKHCVAGQKSDMVIDLPVYQKNRVVKKESYVARVRGEYHAGDLALVELKDKDTLLGPVARIAPEDTELFMGEDVWTLGYPLAWTLTISQGLFGGFETSDFAAPGAEYFRATPDIAGGNSGGALYHRGLVNYEIIGVTTARARSDSFVGLYTPLEVIHAYLKVALPEAVKAD